MTRQDAFAGAPLRSQTRYGTGPGAVDAGGSWLKLADAAHLLGVSEITLRRRVRQGTLRHEFRGGRYYVFVPEGADAESLLGDAPALPVEARGTLPSLSTPAAATRERTLPSSRKQVAYSAPKSGPAPTPSQQPLQQGDGAMQQAQGPSVDQIVAILTIEVREKEKEILELRRALTDQVTLNQALEAALAEALGSESTA